MSTMLKQLNTELQQLVNDAKTLRLSMEEKFKAAGNKDYEGIAADREKLEKMTERGETINAQIKALNKAEELAGVATVPEETAPVLAPAAIARRKSVGGMVIESPQFKAAQRTGNLERVDFKSLEELTGAAGGFLVFSDRDERLREIPQQPFTVLDYILTLTTTSNLVEIIQEATNVNNAAVVAEKATKPESNITFAKMNIPIVTIATWVAITRQLLEDAPRVRSFIDTRLRTMVRRTLENQIVSGTGGATQLLGLTEQVGTIQRTHAVASNGLGLAGDNLLDTLRHAITDLELAFFRPTAFFINPRLADRLELLKDTTGNYLMRYDPVTSRVWRIPAIGTASLADGKAILLDREMSCELYMRDEVSIFTGQPFIPAAVVPVAGGDAIGKDMFLTNQFALLAELRAGFGVTYLNGIVEISALV